MHFYRICLVFFHIASALSYFPHLITHITRIPFRYSPFRSKVAYTTYWFSYCLLVLGVLIWCLIVVCRRKTIWQIIQVSAYVLIAKLIYTLFDVTVRILLNYSYTVIIFDIIHIILLIPAIIFTFLLVQHVKRQKKFQKNSSVIISLEQETLSCN
ncbi:unnamed protein product [Rotaria sp. Silwood2]|nr:unnamed protein product [Rotaria sp. Silwood2]CAF2511806.1 unnamed protein product [Rotaria sp. Silwood2]CAF2871630.1 unnamed protein product [Rotaria sp. Silwood2]CAF3419180.1 unnamed protein product [Rotaria sp. Silwood2]CAF3910473.1 unnamed protein product [Rotaria sp. Silwood2]